MSVIRLLKRFGISHRFGRKKGVIIPMLLAAVGAAGAVLLTADDDDESNKGAIRYNKNRNDTLRHDLIQFDAKFAIK